MCLQTRPLTWLVLIVALAPEHALAQTVQFAELSGHIKLGDSIAVTGGDGRRTKGRVTELTPSTLTLISETVTTTFDERTVRKIARIDSRWNGALMGFAAGAVPGARLAQFSCGEGPVGTCGRAGWAGALVFGGIGAAIGAGVDGLINKAVYVQRQRSARLTFSPVASTGWRGARVSIRF